MSGKLVSHPSGLRVISSSAAPGLGSMRERVEGALVDLCTGLHPMTASGGWFPTEIIARRAGTHLNTAQQHLRLLEALGLAACTRRTDGIGGAGLLWQTTIPEHNRRRA